MKKKTRNKETKIHDKSVCLFSGPAWMGWGWLIGKIVLHYTVWFGRLKSPKPKLVVAATRKEGKQDNILDLLIMKKLEILGAWKAVWGSIGKLQWFHAGELYWLIVTTRTMSGELRGLGHWDVGAIRETCRDLESSLDERRGKFSGKIKQ